MLCGEKMAVQVSTDKELKNLHRKKGFILNVDYLTKDVVVHRTSCPHVNPDNPKGIRPSSKTLNKTGEFWYCNSREDTLQKVGELGRTTKLKLRLCAVCKP
jgi:hypothetical protein